jgi:DNA-binding SARP family transcriptional activator
VPERWPRPSSRSLVKLLAVSPGHRLHREQVLDLCWPESDPQAAQGSLRVALHAARHALEPELAPRASSSYLISEGQMLLLDPETVWVDADAAEQAARTALAGDVEDEIAAALALFTGDLLPEDRYEEWTIARRRTLTDLHRELQVALATARLRAGEVAVAMALAEAILLDAPAEEVAHRILIDGYLRQGLRRSAVRQYHLCRQALEAELGVRPDAATERLHQAALSARPAPVPAPPSLPAPLRAGPVTDLHGRDSLLRSLLDPSAPPVTVLTGDAGIGKTRLAAEVARRAVEDGTAVLWAGGREEAGRTPYAMFADALDGWLVERSAAERAQVGAEYPELAALLPSLGLARIDQDRTPEQERDRLFGAITLLLGGLAEQHPVLFVFDDMHGGDAGSFQLLAHLSRQAAGAGPRLRFLLTVREDELSEDDPRRQQLSVLLRQRVALRHELAPLDKTACLALVADLGGVERERRDRVWELALGNPLFTLELARAYAQGDRKPTPTSINELVTERLNRLDPDARKLVEILAVAGGEASLSELLDVAAHGLHPPVAGAAATSALERALGFAIVEERDVVTTGRSEPGLAFRHPLVRIACYERLTGLRRRALHAAFAEAVLARRPDAVDSLASHFARADDPRAAEYLRRAAERAASLYANDTADRYYRDLVRRLDIDAARARVAHSRVLRRMGAFEEAADSLRLALAEFDRRGDRDDVVHTAAQLAETLVRTGMIDAALDILSQHPPTSDTSPEAAAAHHLALSVARGIAGAYQEAYDASRRALVAAERVPGAAGLGLVARAYANQATNLGLSGQLDEACRVGDRALEPAEGYGDPTLLGSVLSTLRENARRAGRLQDAVEFGLRALTLAERSGDPSATAFEQANLAELKLSLEEFAEARELAESAVAGSDWEGAWPLPYALSALALVRIRAGEADAARPLLARAAEAANALSDRQARYVVSATHAELEALAQPSETLPTVQDARAELDRAVQSGERLAEVEALLVLASSLRGEGHPEEADRELARAEELATALPYPAGLTRARSLRAAAGRR